MPENQAISGGKFGLATRVLLPACFVLCLAGLFAATARAQTVDTLVSNTGQNALSGATPAIEAQSFTTGPHGTGYTLSSISLLPFRDFAGDSGTYVAIKEDSAGRPGALVAALATPDNAYVPGNFFAYTAPASTILQANTTYWIVLNEEQAQTDWQGWGKAASSGEDSASLPGWSIGNSRLQQRGTSWHTVADPLQIEIRGHKNANPALSVAGASALEGSAVRFAVSLDNATDGAVTVQYDTGDDSATAGTDYTAVSSGTLTIPAGDTVAEFSIDTTDDSVDEDDETFTVTLSSPSSNADLGTDTSATGTILDDDGKAVVSVAGGTAVEGSNLGFTVSIRAATDADVTVEYSTSIGTGDTASASDFTAASGETATITAGQTEARISIPTAQDSLDESDETFTLAISNPSSNADLGTATSATGTIEDDDTAGLVLSAPALDVTEGASNSYTVALATEPSANVNVTIAAGGTAGLTLGTSQLTFMPSNWDRAQTVSVSADHDDDASPGSATLTHTASGGEYGSVTATLPVAVTDDDSAAIVLSRTALPVPEDGSATYTVALATLPTEKVTLELAGATVTDLTVTPGTIEFEPGDWNTPVTVTVEAAVDLDADNEPATLTYTASGGDYEGSTASVAVEVVDTVTASITLNKTRVHVKEGGATVAYRVALGLQPANDVTVEVTRVGGAPLFIGASFASGQSATLTFTPDNWDQPQRIYVAASSNTVPRNREYELRHQAAGGGYGSAPIVDLPVLIEEENAQNSYVFSQPALSLAENGTTSYTLKLGKRPSADLSVTIAGGGSSLTVEPSVLSFTRDNWNGGQTVSVTAAAQVSAQDAAKTLTHTGDGGGYDSGALAPGELPVTIVRDVPGIESGGVTLTSSPLHAADTYASGETIAIAVKFDRDVDVDTGGGSPGLDVDIGSSARTLGYAGKSGSRTLKFEYVVQAGDLDSDGLSVGTDALALNGATIRASNGQRDADLGGTALATQGGHRVDGGQTLAAAKLASLGLTHGTASLDLTPQFDADTTAYDATTLGSDDFVTVSASAAEGGNATILPADADGNASGHQVRLDGTETEITVTAVRAPRPNRTYTLKVTRSRPTVSIAADVSTLAFHLQGLKLTVTRAEATAEALDVNLAFTQDQDFLPASSLSRTVTIPADQTSATLFLASGDFSGGATSDGTLTATISADPAYAVGTDASASVAMVAANPAIVVRPGSAEHVFREDSGTQTIRIVAETAAGVPEPTDATFRILARTQNGTAVGGLDYGRIVYSFVNFQASDFAAQDGRFVASKTLDVTITDDALAEDNEDFSLQLIPYGFPDAVSLADADGSLCSSTCEWEIVIVDDDSPPAQVTGVVLTPGGGKLDVAWDEVIGADGYKVQWRSGTETFSNAASDNREAAVTSGSTTTHTISGIADGTVYTVRVIATRDGLEGTPSTEATERPDLRTLTIADATATEGDAVAFTVTLSPAASADVTVGYAATDGTATSDSGHADGADYTAPAADAQLTILAGQTTGTISVATGDDTVDESDESFTVTLADPSSNAVLGTPKTATGTIEDDDVTAAEVESVAFTGLPSDGEYNLGDTIEVSVTFDAAVDVTGTPRVALSLDGTPAADSYALHDRGASSATVLVFRKTVTAADDDDTDGIGVAANALELNGGSIVNQGTTEAADLAHVAVSNGANVDTRWVESIAVTSTPTVPETVTGDPVYGPGETVRFTVKFESAVTVDTGSGVPALKFSASDSGRQDAAYESGSGGTDLVFAWTVPAAVSGDEGAIGVPGNVDAGGTLLTNGGLVLNGGTIEDAGGRAVNVRHGDYTTGSQVDTTGPVLAAGAGGAVVNGNELVLTFERASGVAEHLDEDSEPAPGDFTVTVQGTTRTATGLDVDGASVTVTLASAVGHAQHVTVGYAPGTDRLQDRWGNGVAGFTGRVARNDTAEPALSIASATAAEDDGRIEFAVTLDAASGEAVTVDYATSDGTAKTGTDFAAASGTLEFAAGETSETVEVTLADDALAEGDETFKVTLSNASDASIANGEATGTITDDEGTPILTIADASATEGDAVAFTVTLSPAASADVTVGYAATDGTATSDSGHADGADYTAPAADAQLTILAGQTTGTISVATGDDTVDESDESFTVTLADPSSNAVLGTPKTATGTIEDDDVTAAEVESVAFTGLPSDGEYNLGDTIEVSVTFDAAVDVTGTPRVALSLDGTPAADSYALHDRGASSATVLVFRKTVTAADDDDTDGIGVAANALELNGGSIVNQGTTEAADLAHVAVSNGANVDTRWVESIAVTSTPTVPETVTGDPVYGPGETVRFTVKFESAVTVDTGSGVPALKFSASDSGRQDAAYESGSGGTDLVFAWTVPAAVSGDEGAIGVPGNVDAGGTLLTNGGLVLNGGTIEDAGGRAVNVRHGDYTTGSQVDTTGPVLAAGAGGAVVNGNELVLTFERASGVAEHLDEDSEPAPGDFTVTVQGTTRTATGLDVDGASVTVTLASAVGHAQHVTVGYAPGTDRLQDRWGNGVAGFTGRVARNDTAEPALSIASATAAEDDGRIEFAVTLDAASGEAVTVDYATSDGTAKTGTDFAAASGTLEFAAGETSETVEVTLADDALAEGDETFKVTLSNASDASIANGEATGTITDDEGTPILTIADASATEGDAVAFTVTLSPAASADVTVGYAATDGTATSDSGHADGADYTAPAADAQLTILAGQTTGTISVATGDDSNHEDDETFTLTLADPSSNGALGTPKTATGTIENDDAASADADLKALSVVVGGTQVSLTPAFAAGTPDYEADVENTAAGVTVTAQKNHRGATVAIAGDDDTSTPNTADLALAFGENTVTVTVTAQDGVTEKEYRVKVTRAAPVFEWAHDGINIGEDEGDVEIAVSLTPALTQRVSVDYATEDNSASSTPGEDYTPTSGTLNFEPGETRKTFTLSILDDAVYEPTNAGNVVLNLSNATAPATFGRNGTVLLVIVGPDNDSPATATMEDVSVDEDGGTMTFVMNLSHPVDGEVAYTATSARIGGTATESDDYGRFVSFGRASISITAGQTSASLQVTIVDDDIDEEDETLAIEWHASTGSLLVETATVNVTGTIVDDDTRGVTVSETALPVSEGGTATYTVVLDSEPTGNVTVTPSRSGGDTDVTVGGALTFTPSDWDTAQTVTVSAAEDADAVNDTATVSHAVAGADYGQNGVTAGDVSVTVSDNETASTEVRLSLSQDALAEGAGSTIITVTGTLNGASLTADTPVTVSVGAGGDGAVEGTDYGTVADFTLTINAGETTGTATFALAPVDDGLDEDGESLTVGGTTTISALTVSEATLTIEDDDTRGVMVSETALPVPEGGTATYTVVLDSQPTGNVTVTPSRSSGDTDVKVSGALTFTPSNWDTEQTVTVSAAEDADAVNDTATVSHAVAGADYGANSVPAADVAVTVSDNETASTGIVLSLSKDAVAEDAGATSITVTGTLDGAPLTADTPVTVSVSAPGDTASEGTDYGTVADFTLTINAGETTGTATFTLTPTDDGLDEDDESLTVGGTTAVSGLTVSSATLTIEDDDTRGVTVSETALPVPEGGTATYTVVLDSEPTGTVTVTPSRSSGDTDVTVSGALTFTPSTWDTEQTVSVSAAEDADAESDAATVSHAVAGADYGANSVTAADVAVTVSDNETASDNPGKVTGLTVDATANRVALNWTAPSGTVLGYRIEASYDGGSSWAEVMADTGGTGTAYTHRSGLMAGETRHYRISAIFGGGGGTGPASEAAEASATITVGGLTVTGLAVEDAPHGEPTVDLCWKPTDVAASDLGSFAIQKRKLHPSMPGTWSDEVFSPWSPSDAADCEAGSIGLRVSSGIVANVRYAFRMRAKHEDGWALSNDAEAASVDMTRDFRTEVMAGNSGEAGDAEVPATVCRDYDDPATPEKDAGTFIVNIGFTTGPELFLYYEEVDGFALGDDVTLVNASAELIDRPYSQNLGYRVRITPTDWGQPVAVSVPAGAVTHAETGAPNLASNVFRRNTSDAADCGAGSTATLYQPFIRTVEILDDDDRNGNWAAGEHVSVAIDFREDVVVATEGGVPSVTLTVDGETLQAPYARGSGSEILVFAHAVTTAQSPVYSVALLADSLSLNGGTIASPNGPSAELGHAGATKEGRRPPPPPPGPSLTAQWEKFPPGHSGDGRKFVVRVKFSEPVTVKARSLRDHALTVTDGVIDGLWQVADGSGEKKGDLWAIRLMPTSTQPLALTLAATPDCTAEGAICTADKRPLSRAISLTVPGPEHEVTVADAEVEEGPGAELGFVVTLSGAAPYRVKVDYRTADDTATAGLDYTAVSGRLIFERGETSKTIAVPVLEDSHDDDGETLTLMLSNPTRATIVDGEAVGTIRNRDPMPRAWLARFGRTVADQVIDAVEGRMGAARAPGTEVSLAGRRVGAAGLQETDLDSREAEAGLETLADWLRGAGGEEETSALTSRAVSGHELLSGTSFALTAGSAESGFGALWGRGAVSSFDGREGEVTLDGEVASALLGADFLLGRGTAGLVVAHSLGEGGYRSPNGEGEVESTLTGLYPWGRYEVSERLSLWGVAGYGAGTLTLTPEGQAPIETDMDLTMAALGGRGVVAEAPAEGGLELSVTSDALVVRTTSEAVRGSAGSLAASEADVTRLRLGLEGTWRGLGTLVPTLEVGARHDGGDAETGFGADIGGRLVWSDPALGIEAELAARGLLTHEDGSLSERGFAGSLAWDPSPDNELGAKLTLSQAAGAEATGGMDALLRPETARVMETTNDDGPKRRRLEARLGYGIALFGGSWTGVPEVGLGLTETGREYIHAWRLLEARRGDLELRFEASRLFPANDDPENRIGVRLTARW